MNDLTAHEILVATRNTLEGRWYQGEYCSADGSRFCVLGAMRYAVGMAPGAMENGSRVDPARHALAAVLGLPAYDIPTWNDVQGRTEAQVLAALDRAIAASAPEPDLALETRDPIPA